MQPMQHLLEKPIHHILGLMSGTSCDGLDLARIRIAHSGQKIEFELLNSKTYPYSDKQKKHLLRFLQAETTSARELSRLNFYLPRLWSEMILTFIEENHLSKKDIDLIGSHGQTVWHEPQPARYIDRQVSSTFQLGDPSVLAQATGIPVVGDFRTADVALGGQGAPLIPYFDWIYFSKFKQNILSVNIGGISNVTLVPANGNINTVAAFDCGPGNMLIDLAASRLFGLPFDEEGRLARSGKENAAFFKLLKEEDPFTEMAPPKSTGRELYGRTYLERLLKKARKWNLDKADILNGLTRYTAYSIFENYQRFIRPAHRAEAVVIGGGGAHNRFLMEALAQYFSPVPVSFAGEYGIDPNFKEAIGFAVLANETMHGTPANVPSATGASRRAVLGKICMV